MGYSKLGFVFLYNILWYSVFLFCFFCAKKASGRRGEEGVLKFTV